MLSGRLSDDLKPLQPAFPQGQTAPFVRQRWDLTTNFCQFVLPPIGWDIRRNFRCRRETLSSPIHSATSADSVNPETVNAKSSDIILGNFSDVALPFWFAEIKALMVEGVAIFIKHQPPRLVAFHFAVLGASAVRDDVLPNFQSQPMGFRNQSLILLGCAQTI